MGAGGLEKTWNFNPQDLTALVLLAWLIFKTVPKGFAVMKDAMEAQGKLFDTRHKEAIAALVRVEKACRDCPCRRTTAKKKPPPKQRR